MVVASQLAARAGHDPDRSRRWKLYRLPFDHGTSADGESIHLWSARDAVVLKALTLVLADVLPISTRCTHIKGNGGLKGAVRGVAQNLQNHRFVLRTDVKSYYASIDHGALIERLKHHVTDERILGLVRQYLNRTAERGGVFRTFEQGISRGCPLSPLLGAFFLGDLDARLERQATRDGLFYVRYMDDILVLAPTRWKLRSAVRAVNEELAALGLEQHPDKTFVGRIARGFDFLGHHLSLDGAGKALIGLAAKTIDNFREKLRGYEVGIRSASKLSRLYEQTRRAKPQGRPACEAALRTYVKRWTGWAFGGFGAWSS